MTIKNEKKILLVMLLIAVVAGCGMLVWGQYNTARQVYDISFNRYMVYNQLATDETWARSPEEEALYGQVLGNGRDWREKTEKQLRSYTAATASEVFGKTEPIELGYEYYDNGSETTVVLLHAYSETADDAAVFAPFWWEKGFNIIIPELRGHSQTSETTTFGCYEQYDLLDLIRHEKLGGESRLVVHGKGMGAAAPLLLAGSSFSEEASLDLIVSDNVYSNLKELELKQLKQQFKLGNFMIGIFLDSVAKSKLGFSIEDIDTAKAAERMYVPAVFISGENDGFIGPEHSETVYQAAGSEKELLRVNGAEYGMSYAVSRIQYEDLLNKWIEKLGFIS